jgi:hypothetical protein
MSFGGCFTAAQEMEALKAGLASDSDPDRCRCRGRGWILADSDVWVQCPAHHAGQAHPEVEAYQASTTSDICFVGKAIRFINTRNPEPGPPCFSGPRSYAVTACSHPGSGTRPTLLGPLTNCSGNSHHIW